MGLHFNTRATVVVNLDRNELIKVTHHLYLDVDESGSEFQNQVQVESEEVTISEPSCSRTNGVEQGSHVRGGTSGLVRKAEVVVEEGQHS